MGTDPLAIALDDEGREIPDPTPIVIRVKNRQVTDFDQVRNFIRQELSAGAAASGRETMEEANDFDVDDELFPPSPHEYTEDTEAADREAIEVVKQRREAAAKAKKAKKLEPPSAPPKEAPGGAGGGRPPETPPADD